MLTTLLPPVLYPGMRKIIQLQALSTPVAKVRKFLVQSLHSSSPMDGVFQKTIIHLHLLWMRFFIATKAIKEGPGRPRIFVHYKA